MFYKYTLIWKGRAIVIRFEIWIFTNSLYLKFINLIIYIS